MWKGKVPKYREHKNRGNKEETLTEKMKGSPDERRTHKYTEASLIPFDNHRCLSQSKKSKCM